MKIPTSERNKAITWDDLHKLALKYKHKNARYYADLIFNWRLNRSRSNGK